jgi:hypothetical protein
MVIFLKKSIGKSKIFYIDEKFSIKQLSAIQRLKMKDLKGIKRRSK